MAKRIIRREPIDFKLALKGSQEINVFGIPSTDLRISAIQKAIGLSQKDPDWNKMNGGDGKKYFAVRVYEGYPEILEERTDYIPLKYGAIEFKIEWKDKVTEAGIYYLELFLHNPGIDVGWYFERFKILKSDLGELEKEIKKIEYEKEYWR